MRGGWGRGRAGPITLLLLLPDGVRRPLCPPSPPPERGVTAELGAYLLRLVHDKEQR